MQTARRSAFRTVEGPAHRCDLHLDRAAGQDGTVLGQRGCKHPAKPATSQPAKSQARLGRTALLGYYRRDRPGPHQPALARRALLPLHREVGLRLLETYRSLTASGFLGAYGGIGNTGHDDPERNE
jgi:hypothetical protein